MLNNKYASQRGFTILELIVVVGVLGLITSLTTDYMVNETNQQRYQATKKRIAQIHYAFIGDSSRSLNNQPVFSGYLADTGQVPKYLRDLLSNGYCTNAILKTESDCTAGKAEWREVTNWKGPYLQATANKKLMDETGKVVATIPVFRDGWGNHLDYNNQDVTSVDNLNFGWGYVKSSVANQAISITSYGLNGVAGKDDENSKSPTYVFEQNVTQTISASRYQGVAMPVSVITNNPEIESAMFCLQARYPDGKTKTIDLSTQQTIPAGDIFGQVTVSVFKKNMSVNDTCASTTRHSSTMSKNYYAHNLFGASNTLNIVINE